jgi:predicted glycosyltransferase involved in capsule biosynthesis
MKQIEIIDFIHFGKSKKRLQLSKNTKNKLCHFKFKVYIAHVNGQIMVFTNKTEKTLVSSPTCPYD